MNQQVATINQSSLPTSAAASFATLQGFELLQRVAKAFAYTKLVPKDYQGDDGIPACIVAINIANRIGADPLMVMQNLVVVHGRPTWSSQFLISTVNTCGRFSALRYEFFGEKNTDDWGCRAWAVEKATGEKLEGTDITIGLAKAEGWYGKNGSKWKTMAQQMLMYRAGAWWARAYAPELSMGLHTADEARDGIIDVTAEEVPASEAIKNVTKPAIAFDSSAAQMAAFAGEEDQHDEDGVVIEPEPEPETPALSAVAQKAIDRLSAAQTLADFHALSNEMSEDIRKEIGGERLAEMAERLQD